ncbi:McrC family protein [Campylobacter concisus]|uniref:McrC family protein n=1 Tax=Campylobacter concisus TaxID=199 RepID=UPI003D1E996E
MAIVTNDNFFGNYEQNKKIQKKEKTEFSLTLSEYAANGGKFLSFLPESKEKEDELIISTKKQDDGFYVQTGNFIGSFSHNGIDIEINSRFSNKFLERMLNFANDIYVDDVSLGKSIDAKKNLSRIVIYYLFIQALERAFLLGLPKEYKNKSYHEAKVMGKVDIAKFIKKDVPFAGKISSTNRERQDISDIVLLLHKALKIVQKESKELIKPVINTLSYLNEIREPRLVTPNVIHNALNSKALHNPIYAPYKKVLEYAKLIIENENAGTKSNGKQNLGFLVDVAELFEIYIRKLLQKEFKGWSVTSPKIELYKDKFFARKIIPDIVMGSGDQVLVFDTKYKRMNMQGKDQYGLGDVDRNDFFQINTYMSYYQNQGKNVIAGGLLYPMNKFSIDRCHSHSWFENLNTKFIVDGIELTNLNEPSIDEIKIKENEFISRIKEYIY